MGSCCSNADVIDSQSEVMNKKSPEELEKVKQQAYEEEEQQIKKQIKEIEQKRQQFQQQASGGGGVGGLETQNTKINSEQSVENIVPGIQTRKKKTEKFDNNNESVKNDQSMKNLDSIITINNQQQSQQKEDQLVSPDLENPENTVNKIKKNDQQTSIQENKGIEIITNTINIKQSPQKQQQQLTYEQQQEEDEKLLKLQQQQKKWDIKEIKKVSSAEDKQFYAEIQEKRLNNLQDYIKLLYKYNYVENLKILSFQNNQKITDYDIKQLCYLIQTLDPKMKKIYISLLCAYNITDDSLAHMGEAFQFFLELQSLQLDLGNVQNITDMGMTRFCNKVMILRDLKSLIIDLSGCHNLGDFGIIKIISTLRHLEKLEILNLFLYKTDISDSVLTDLANLFQKGLKNIKNINIQIIDTQATNEGFINLAKGFENSKGSIQEFKFSLRLQKHKQIEEYNDKQQFINKFTEIELQQDKEN